MAEREPCPVCVGKGGRTGCTRCGGYGYIAESRLLTCCSRVAWFRPGAFTKYEGKEYRSYDGVEMVSSMDGDVCAQCFKKGIGKIKARHVLAPKR